MLGSCTLFLKFMKIPLFSENFPDKGGKSGKKWENHKSRFGTAPKA